MRRYILLCAVVFAAFSCKEPADVQTFVENPVDLVNPLMGTDSKFDLSNGNTYPAIAMPWGMNFWTPQTGEMGNGWGYQYSANHIRGFKQTHQPSPWINDYGQFAVMTTTGTKTFDQESRKSWFSHKSETAKPYYYSVYLADYDVITEIAPTERSAQFRITYPDSEKSHIIVDAFDGGSYVKVLPAERKIVGYTTKNSGGVPANFKNWFVIYSDKAFDEVATWLDGKIREGNDEAVGAHAGAIVSFKTAKGEKVGLRIASSFISLDQAELNLSRELASDDFDATRAKGRDVWNTELNRIQIAGGTLDAQRTFYSCLYRALLFPRKFYEVDATNQIVHYSPYNGEVLPGYMFTDNGFWDTFRAVFPFLALMYPEMNSHIMQGLANTYRESGWLPEWASPGHRDCMIGSNSASLIADSYIKGIKNPDVETLYEAMIKNSENAGPIMSVGRAGADHYVKLGYVPYDVNVKENVARSLEYAYADFCIAQLGKALSKPQAEVDKYMARAENYKKLYDSETKLMRGKNADGTFQSPFNPYRWGDAYTEGNAWHYTWSVFQDVDGLIGLMGGREGFNQMLDSVFVVPPIFDDSYYGFPIHEIREMQIMNMGNYAHGNQPIQHMIYLYNYAGEPWKAQYWINRVMNSMYTPTPDGYCGDEDNGQTSAWYVFSGMGFYPVTPGVPEYVIGTPAFSKVVIHLENGKEFVINAENAGREKFYIESATLNGKPMDRNYIGHDELTAGGEITFKMSDKPNKSRGVDPSAAPFSMSRVK